LLKRKKALTVDISPNAEALGLPFSEEAWRQVQHFTIKPEKTSIEDRKTIVELSKTG